MLQNGILNFANSLGQSRSNRISNLEFTTAKRGKGPRVKGLISCYCPNPTGIQLPWNLHGNEASGVRDVIYE